MNMNMNMNVSVSGTLAASANVRHSTGGSIGKEQAIRPVRSKRNWLSGLTP